MNTEEAIFDISSEISSSEEFFEEEAPLLVFRVIGCTFVTVLVGFTIIIYVTSGMYHVDCLAQINAEFGILAAYMLILLTTTESSKITEGMCISVAFFLHISSLGAFFFSFLEVLCICQVFVPFIQSRVHLKPFHIIVIGWAIPLIIGGVTLIWYKENVRKSNCWMDRNKPLFWATVIPIGIFIALQVILLLLVFCSTDVPITVPQSEYKRAKSFLGTRWASGIILLLLISAWTFGLLAYNTKKDTMYGAFTVFSILLGVCIFTLRISTDEEIRAVIVNDVLCCLLPKNKVTSFSIQASQAKKQFSSENQNELMKSKIAEAEENSVTSHK